MASLDKHCRSTARLVENVPFAEGTWRAFGYEHTPPRLTAPPVGFTPAARRTLELETTLLQELWAAAFGAVFDWAWGAPNFTNRVAFVAKVTELCIDGSGEPIWPAFRFATRPDAVVFLVHSGEDYLGLREPVDRVRLFTDRCGRRTGQPVPDGWAPMARSLFMTPDSELPNITGELNRTGVTKAVDDVEVQGVYLQIFEDRDWPRTLEAAVEQLLSRMTDADKNVVRDTAEGELGGFHFGWAMGVRNEFGMWRGTPICWRRAAIRILTMRRWSSSERFGSGCSCRTSHDLPNQSLQLMLYRNGHIRIP